MHMNDLIYLTSEITIEHKTATLDQTPHLFISRPILVSVPIDTPSSRKHILATSHRLDITLGRGIPTQQLPIIPPAPPSTTYFTPAISVTVSLVTFEELGHYYTPTAGMPGKRGVVSCLPASVGVANRFPSSISSTISSCIRGYSMTSISSEGESIAYGASLVRRRF